MNILFLTHRTPYPPNKGTQGRPFYLLTALQKRGHNVHLLAFAEGEKDLAAQEKLARFCASVTLIPFHRRLSEFKAMLTLFSRRPLSLGYFGSGEMRRAVKQVMEKHSIDAVVTWSSAMAQYVPPEMVSQAVIDMGDVDSEKWRDYAKEKRWPMSWVYQTESRRLRRYEYEIIRKHAQTVLVAPREAALLNELDDFTRRARLQVITSGVDLERFHPEAFPPYAPEAVPALEKHFLSDPHAIRIVFTGAMDYYPNAEAVCYFAEEVFPHIRKQVPHAEFLIVGSDPTDEVVKLRHLPGVKVTGFVEDVRPYLAAAAVCVVPLKIARGVQNKALEAMSSGRAVVVTPDVMAGLKAVEGEHLLVAHNTTEFVDAVLKLINDTEFREHLGKAARSFIEHEYDWNPLIEKLAKLIESVGNRSASASQSRTGASVREMDR